MDKVLHIVLIVGTCLFFAYIINMIRIRKLELKYTLLWLFTSISFVVIAIFPGILRSIAKLLFIKEPVNALFLIIFFFLIMIIFSLTVAISAKSTAITALTQEIGIIKLKIDKLTSVKAVEEKTKTATEKGKKDGNL